MVTGSRYSLGDARGTNPYVIAQQYNVHVKTVSPTIVISTVMSVDTVFFVLVYYGVG